VQRDISNRAGVEESKASSLKWVSWKIIERGGCQIWIRQSCGATLIRIAITFPARACTPDTEGPGFIAFDTSDSMHNRMIQLLLLVLLNTWRTNQYLLACEAPSSRLWSTLSGNKTVCHITNVKLYRLEIAVPLQ
jgi:hypothetical protein